jgi:hypothetical protein
VNTTGKTVALALPKVKAVKTVQSAPTAAVKRAQKPAVKVAVAKKVPAKATSKATAVAKPNTSAKTTWVVPKKKA